jgi:hypothetical protein
MPLGTLRRRGGSGRCLYPLTVWSDRTRSRGRNRGSCRTSLDEVQARGDDIGGIAVHNGARVALLPALARCWSLERLRISSPVRGSTSSTRVSTSSRGSWHLEAVCSWLRIGTSDVGHRAVCISRHIWWMPLFAEGGAVRHDEDSRLAPLRRFDESSLGGYESCLLAITNPWEVVSCSSSGVLRIVA